MEANIATRHVFIHYVIFLTLLVVQNVHDCCMLIVGVDRFRMLARILFSFRRSGVYG